MKFLSILVLTLFIGISASAQTRNVKGKTILLIGDSMAQGMNPHFAKIVKSAGAKYCQSYKVGSRLEYWSTYRFKRALNVCKPDIIFVVLGANHLYDKKNALLQDARNTNTILQQVNGKELYWVGSPSWRKSTGVEELIKGKVGADRYFESRNFTWKRVRDGIHLTTPEFKRLSTEVWKWFLVRKVLS
jgi:hypothetical protein